MGEEEERGLMTLGPVYGRLRKVQKSFSKQSDAMKEIYYDIF